MAKTKILSFQDWVQLAEGLDFDLKGKYGVMSLFKLVQWVDERMGMDMNGRYEAISQLVSHAKNERIDGERTLDALSFERVSKELWGIMHLVAGRVEIARKS